MGAGALERFIRWVCRDARFHGHYPATVELVHGDGTVDLTADDPELAGTGLSHVPVECGLPATDAVGAAGARCLVAFAAGDPKRPRVSEWEGGPAQYIRLGGGAAGVSGIGDVVEVALPEVIAVSGIIEAGIVTPPPPAPPFPLAAIPFNITVTVPPGTVSCVVMGGNPKILV